MDYLQNKMRVSTLQSSSTHQNQQQSFSSRHLAARPRLAINETIGSQQRSKQIQSPPQGGGPRDDNHTFLVNNFDVIDSHVTERGNTTCYYAQSIFDQQFYIIKRRKIRDMSEDLQNREQLMMINVVSQHESLTEYNNSFYVNKSMYIMYKAAPNNFQGKFPIRNMHTAITLFVQICQAVNHLHRNNLCLGILSPEILYLENDSKRVRLGLQHLYEVNRQLKLSLQEDFSHALAYMAPEAYFSRAGDVWGLGILLHEMLTGEKPIHKGQTVILSDTLVDTQLSTLLKQILVRDPNKRIKLDDLIFQVIKLQHDSDTASSPNLLMQGGHQNPMNSFEPQQPTGQATINDNSKQTLIDLTLSTILKPPDQTKQQDTQHSIMRLETDGQTRDLLDFSLAQFTNDSRALITKGKSPQVVQSSQLTSAHHQQMTPDFKQRGSHSSRPVGYQYHESTSPKLEASSRTIKLSQTPRQKIKVKAVRNQQKQATPTLSQGNTTKIKDYCTSADYYLPTEVNCQNSPSQNALREALMRDEIAPKSPLEIKAESIRACVNFESPMVNLNERGITDDLLDILLESDFSLNLRILSLNNNSITDVGFALLATHLHKYPNLRVLYLSKLQQ
ncbi:hypothetical protein FGO68_gene7977 [Halteria grandinella]|uniref:non-specific serine/threonine protein kinase n=1 Tax=Halteria grandinella TaxID=5974 RepID=A0A8J8NTB4_HALGN|nr:hypothetical protein FGO68_gene7977 [Halteria grandinella]